MKRLDCHRTLGTLTVTLVLVLIGGVMCTTLRHSDRGVNVPRHQAEFFMNNPHNDKVSELVSETYYESYWLWGTQNSGHPIDHPEDPFNNLLELFHDKYGAKRYVNVRIISQNGIFNFVSFLLPPANGFWQIRTVMIEAGIVENPVEVESAPKS